MTENSYICNFIKSHPKDWRELLAEKQIKVKEGRSLLTLNYAIFNYDIMADFSDVVVQEARGIILDIHNVKNPTVVAWPFRKFGNSHESYVDTIDWNSARVQEKIDGSIIKLWFNHEGGYWHCSSNGCIRAEDAELSSGYNLMDLIRESKEYAELMKNDDMLDKNCTYIFELVSPKNQIVVKYDTTKLYHIGTRNNLTGEEFSDYLPFMDHPKSYALHSLDDCVKAAGELNKQTAGGYPTNEGFVVVDQDFHRIKVKSPEYLIYHHMVNNGQITRDRAYDIITSDDYNLSAIVRDMPQHVAEAVIWYDKGYKENWICALSAMDYARKMQKSGMSRKDIALSIKSNPYSYFMFKALDSTQPTEEILKANGKKLMGLVQEFPTHEKEIEEDERDL